MDASERTRPKRKLVLHFDINSTILMKDTAKGIASVQFTVSAAIPDCVPAIFWIKRVSNFNIYLNRLHECLRKLAGVI